jgi:hypothetical protein
MPDPGQALETVKVKITEVPITPDVPSGIKVDKEPFRVSKEKDTSRLQVEWICDSSGFTVEFEGESPFAQRRFTRPSPGAVFSGRVRDNVQSDDHIDEPRRKNYRYTVTTDKGSHDPNGQVDQ